MRATPEKARLIKELIEVIRLSGAPVPVRTSEQVEAMLKRARQEMPGAGDLSDEVLLRDMINYFRGNHRVALRGDEAEVMDLIEVGKELFYEHRFKEAREVLLQAEELSLRLGDELGHAWAKQYLGRIERDSGNFDEAMHFYEPALELAQGVPDARLVAVLYDQIGTTFRYRGDLDRAEEYYQLALEAHPDSASFAKSNLAEVHQMRGQAKRASAVAREGRAACRSQGELRNEAMLCSDRARACLSRMDYRAAAKSALEAYHAAVATKYVQVLCNVDDIFCHICQDLMGITDGLAEFRKVLGMEWKADEWQFRHQLLMNLFMYCANRGLVREAAETAWTIAKLAEVHNDIEGLADLREPLKGVRDGLERTVGRTDGEKPRTEVGENLLALALCQAALGEPEAALRRAREAESLFEAGSAAEGLRRVQQLRHDLRQQPAE